MTLRYCRALLGVALTLAWINLGHAQSTINTAMPATSSDLTSLVVRQQFLAAASDINGLLSKHAATSTSQCPATPFVGEDCLTIGSTPFGLNMWTGGTAGWAQWATINPSTGVVTVPLNASDIAASFPLVASFPAGVATISLNFNASLVLDGSNNLGINLANPNTFTATQTFPAGSLTNAELANSTISGISLGSNLDLLTFGTHLTAGGASYNGSAGVTISSDATSLNTASTQVARDSSGNFAAGTITASLTGHASLDLAASALGTNVQTALGNTLNASGGLVGFGGNIGAASGTSLALGGCTIGSNIFCVTGSMAVSVNVAANTFNNVNITQPASTATLTLGSAKTFMVNNSLTLAGTDGSTLNIGAGGTLGSNAFNSTAFAPLASPALTGVPTTPTAAVSTNTTQVASTAFVLAQVAASTAGVASLNSLTGALSIGAGAGISVTPSGSTVTVAANLTNLTNSLASPAAFSTGAFTDGPTVAQGASGTWHASGSISWTDTTANGAAVCKLWDGTTIIDTGAGSQGGTNQVQTISLSGNISSPAGNIRISCESIVNTTASMSSTAASQAKTSTVSVFRIQ
jgi:hypothetical protein